MQPFERSVICCDMRLGDTYIARGNDCIKYFIIGPIEQTMDSIATDITEYRDLLYPRAFSSAA